MMVILDLVNKSWTNVAEMYFIGFVDPENISLDLDLVNKSWTNVAEMYFIGFVDPENISLGTKSKFISGLEIKISF